MEIGELGPGFGAFPRRSRHQDSHGNRRAQGQPLRFALTGGQAADAPQAIPLLIGIETSGVITGEGYDSNEVLDFIRSQGAIAVMPPKSGRKNRWNWDRDLYRKR